MKNRGIMSPVFFMELRKALPILSYSMPWQKRASSREGRRSRFSLCLQEQALHAFFNTAHCVRCRQRRNAGTASFKLLNIA